MANTKINMIGVRKQIIAVAAGAFIIPMINPVIVKKRGKYEMGSKMCRSCRALTDKASGSDVEHVIDEVENETDDAVGEYYRIFLNLIAEKNPGVFEEIRRDAMKF